MRCWLSSEKRQPEKLSYEKKANLRAQTQLPTSMRNNFLERSCIFIFIFPERALTLAFTCNFNSYGHQSTDIQVYNERRSNKQNVPVGNSKTTVVFLYYFKY